jgi:hypothetical protein
MGDAGFKHEVNASHSEAATAACRVAVYTPLGSEAGGYEKATGAAAEWAVPAVLRSAWQ